MERVARASAVVTAMVAAAGGLMAAVPAAPVSPSLHLADIQLTDVATSLQTTVDDDFAWGLNLLGVSDPSDQASSTGLLTSDADAEADLYHVMQDLYLAATQGPNDTILDNGQSLDALLGISPSLDSTTLHDLTPLLLGVDPGGVQDIVSGDGIGGGLTPSLGGQNFAGNTDLQTFLQTQLGLDFAGISATLFQAVQQVQLAFGQALVAAELAFNENLLGRETAMIEALFGADASNGDFLNGAVNQAFYEFNSMILAQEQGLNGLLGVSYDPNDIAASLQGFDGGDAGLLADLAGLSPEQFQAAIADLSNFDGDAFFSAAGGMFDWGQFSDLFTDASLQAAMQAAVQSVMDSVFGIG